MQHPDFTSQMARERQERYRSDAGRSRLARRKLPLVRLRRRPKLPLVRLRRRPLGPRLGRRRIPAPLPSA